MTTQEKVHKILAFCLDENEKGNTLFFQFSGHVRWLSVSVTLGGWSDRKPQTEVLRKFIDTTDFETFDADKWIEETKKILHPANQLLNQKQ